MSLFDGYWRCQRCGGQVDDSSAFAVVLRADGGRLVCDIILSRNVLKDDVVMHLSADRECEGKVSGYLGKMLKTLGLPITCDTSEIESL